MIRASLVSLLFLLCSSAFAADKIPKRPRFLDYLPPFDYDQTYQYQMQYGRLAHLPNPGKYAIEKTADIRQSQYPAMSIGKKRALWQVELKWIDAEHDRVSRENMQRALDFVIEAKRQREVKELTGQAP